MRRLLIALVILCIVFVWAPQVIESAPNACGALEQKSVMSETGSELGTSLVQKLSGGALAEQAMADKHPNLPASLACSLEYWKTTTGLGE
jgi:hypothetical protein